MSWGKVREGDDIADFGINVIHRGIQLIKVPSQSITAHLLLLSPKTKPFAVSIVRHRVLKILFRIWGVWLDIKALREMQTCRVEEMVDHLPNTPDDARKALEQTTDLRFS